MTRIPFNAWKSTAATRPNSIRPTSGVFKCWITSLETCGLPRARAVSKTCTNKKKKIVAPVMRCNTHDHMPGSPRYRVRGGRRLREGDDLATAGAVARSEVVACVLTQSSPPSWTLNDTQAGQFSLTCQVVGCA